MRYGVSFRAGQGAKTYYGIVDEYSDEAKKAKKEGFAIVEDLIRPRYYRVPEMALVDISFEEIDKICTEELEKAQKKADSVEGIKAGAMFTIGVADGCAFYVVTRVSGKTCFVEWRGFGGDRYYDHHFGSGGKFPVKEIERYVRVRQGLKKLFGKENKK